MLLVDDLSYSCFLENGESNIIFKDASFQAEAGQVTVILGLSGSGKTTLFQLITGLLKASEGNFSWKGEPLTRNHIEYMQQRDSLLAWRNVEDNITITDELGKVRKRKNKAYLNRLLEMFDIQNLLTSYPDQLSGGMRQRVALASACYTDRPILLLDEPFSSVDVIIKEQLYAEINFLKEKENKTVILVTHDFRDALFLGDKFYVIQDHKINQVIIDHQSIAKERSSLAVNDLKSILQSGFSQ